MGTGKTIVGVLLLMAALAGALVYLIVPIALGGQDALALAAVGFAVAAWGGVLGIALIWDGARAPEWLAKSMGRPRLWRWILVLGVGLLGGIVALRVPGSAYLFPPFNLLTLLAWAGILYSLLAFGLEPLKRGDVPVQLAYGSFFATTFGGILEAILSIALAVLVLLVSSAFPAGRQWVTAIQQALQQPQTLADTTRLVELMRLPPVSITLGAALVLIAPLVEESLKALGVLLVNARTSTRAQYIARGALCGLGFGLMESAVNLASGGSGWALGAGVRALTMGLHGLTGALMGGAWYYAVRERKLAPALGVYALCLAVHGLWNGVAFAAAFSL